MKFIISVLIVSVLGVIDSHAEAESGVTGIQQGPLRQVRNNNGLHPLWKEHMIRVPQEQECF
jgi:hypothetical protein